MYTCIYSITYMYLYVCMYECMYLYVFMYECMCKYVFIYQIEAMKTNAQWKEGYKTCRKWFDYVVKEQAVELEITGSLAAICVGVRCSFLHCAAECCSVLESFAACVERFNGNPWSKKLCSSLVLSCYATHSYTYISHTQLPVCIYLRIQHE